MVRAFGVDASSEVIQKMRMKKYNVSSFSVFCSLSTSRRTQMSSLSFGVGGVTSFSRHCCRSRKKNSLNGDAFSVYRRRSHVYACDGAKLLKHQWIGRSRRSHVLNMSHGS
ncbi:uncharacterized protein LOC140706000 [Pogona vitticeps]